MLRRILLSTVFAAAAGSALAADLPYRSAAPAPYMAPPVFTWTGFYVGLNAGAGFNKNRGYSATGFAVAPTFYTGSNGDDVGFTGGAQAGYNMQFGSFVAGLEADINYIDRNKGSVALIPAPAAAAGDYFAINRGGDNNWFGTVRGRLGYAFDRALVYATGGLAYGGRTGNSTVSYVDPAPGLAVTTLASTGGSNSSVGWTLGGGVEYAFSNSMSFKLEYLHVDLGRNSRTYVTAAPLPAGTIVVRADNKFDVVRAGVNFRF